MVDLALDWREGDRLSDISIVCFLSKVFLMLDEGNCMGLGLWGIVLNIF